MPTLIAAGARLVVIGRAGVGVDNVDLDAATRAGITVVNAPTGNTIAAAEHTLALLYGVARRTAAADASVRRGEWKRAAVHRAWSCVAGRSGSSGSARSARPSPTGPGRWRWSSWASTRTSPPEQAANHGVELIDLDELLLERADVVTVHVPLTRATRGLIGARPRSPG